LRKLLAVALTLIGLSSFGVKPVIAEAPQSKKLEFIEIKAEIKKPQSIEEMIVEHAKKYGVNPTVALAVAKCESGFKAGAVGDKGTSFGVYQIHLPAHPTVTKEQALDPHWAIEWSMPRLKSTPRIWSCYRLLY
jgi:soluble lytic murein transglycosylase-like protein